MYKKNMAEPNMPQMTIWRMRIARWKPKATNTQTENVKRITLPRQQWLYERASLLRCSTGQLKCDGTRAETSFRLSVSPFKSAGASVNPLNAELNPICHLLALLGAHPILHVSRIAG